MTQIETLTGSEIESNVLQAPGTVVLDFYQASCQPCRALEPRLERVAQQYQGQLRVYRVDLDRDLPVAERFDVTSLPTVLIFRDGKETERLDGLVRESDLAAAFDRTIRA